MHSFTFNGHSSDEFRIRIEKMPVLNRSARKFLAASVPGHNGNIYELQNAWEEVVQPYQIFAGDRTGGAVATFTDIIEWLHSADGYAVLTDTYDPTHYREAIFIDSVDIESEWHTFGRATINFRCRPERYIVTNSIAVQSGDTITNPTNHIALPKITLTSNGAKSFINLNNRTLASEDGQWGQFGTFIPYKDTSIWVAAAVSQVAPRFFAASSITLDNISNADGLIEFTPASSNVAHAGVGLIQSVAPDSDYVLSFDAYSYGYEVNFYETDAGAAIYFISSTGANGVIGYIQNYASGVGWKHCSLSFHTPAECGYVFIIFHNPWDVSLNQRSYKNIMLNGGTVEKPFRPYDSNAVQQVRIGDTILEITTEGYDTIEIDCNKENVTIDDINGNPATKITDQYGNPSATYLQLAKGANVITYSGDISALSVEPRFWNL